MIPLAAILELADATPPVSVEDMAARLDISTGRIYAALREHRPDRPRKPRKQTSVLRAQVLGLHADKIKPSRIAELLRCRRQWVYRIIGEVTT